VKSVGAKEKSQDFGQNIDKEKSAIRVVLWRMEKAGRERKDRRTGRKKNDSKGLI